MEECTNLGKRRKAALIEKKNPLYHKRHQEVVNAAARVFLRKGYEDATLKDISDDIGMDRATLYYYASSKKYLFDLVIRQASEKNIKYIESISRKKITALEKLSLAINGLIESYSHDYPYLAIFLHHYIQSHSQDGEALHHESGEWGRRYYNAMRSIVQEGLEKGEFEFSLPVGVATNALIGMVNWIHLAQGPNAARRKSAGSSEFSADAHGRALLQFILRGLGSVR